MFLESITHVLTNPSFLILLPSLSLFPIHSFIHSLEAIVRQYQQAAHSPERRMLRDNYKRKHS